MNQAIMKAERPGFRLFREMVIRRRLKDVAAEIGARRQRVQRMCDETEADLDFYSCINTHMAALCHDGLEKMAVQGSCLLLQPLGRIPTRVPKCRKPCDQASQGRGGLCDLERQYAISIRKLSDLFSVWANSIEDNRIEAEEAERLVIETQEAICELGGFLNLLKVSC